MVLLQTIMYIGIALLILMFMITVHELGHYIAGKILGFKINEFAIGFGKPIYKRVSKKTGEVFSIRWLPIGGYCAFAGDEAAAGEGGARAEALRREKTSDAPTPSGIEFDKAKPWKRLIVLFSGAFFNFLCAIIFSIVLLMIAGYYQVLGYSSIANTASGDPNPNEALLADVGPEHKNVAYIHGIGRTEDSIQKFSLLKSFNSVIGQYNKDDVLTFRVEYTDGTIENVGGFKLIELQSENGSKYLGIGVTEPKLVWQPMGFFEAIGMAVKFCFEVAWLILTFLWALITGKMNFFGSVGGPIATVSMMSEMVSAGLLNIFILVPLISVNLALFNLLPIPALDGARMVFVGIEWVRKKPINQVIEGRIHMIGLLILLGIVVLADLGFLFGGSPGIFLLNCKLLL